MLQYLVKTWKQYLLSEVVRRASIAQENGGLKGNNTDAWKKNGQAQQNKWNGSWWKQNRAQQEETRNTEQQASSSSSAQPVVSIPAENVVANHAENLVPANAHDEPKDLSKSSASITNLDQMDNQKILLTMMKLTEQIAANTVATSKPAEAGDDNHDANSSQHKE